MSTYEKGYSEGFSAAERVNVDALDALHTQLSAATKRAEGAEMRGDAYNNLAVANGERAAEEYLRAERAEHRAATAERQMAEATSYGWDLKTKLDEARAFIVGTDDGDREYALARIDQALSTPTPHPWGEVIRAAAEETAAERERDKYPYDYIRVEALDRKLVQPSREARRKAVSSLPTSAAREAGEK